MKLILFYTFLLIILKLTSQISTTSKNNIQTISKENELKLTKNLINEEHNKQNMPKQDKLSFTTRLNDYFSKTSKENQSVAKEALTSFIIGLTLFFLSIQIICWNEKRSVKDAEILDLHLDHERCIYIDKADDFKLCELNNTKLFIVNGQISVKEEAYIEHSCIKLKNVYGKVALIKIFHEYYSTRTYRDDKGNVTVVNSWLPKGNNIQTYSIRNSTLLLSDKFVFDSALISDIIPSSDIHYMNNMNDNIQTFIPKDNELKEIYYWIRPNFIGEFKLTVDNQGYVYALGVDRGFNNISNNEEENSAFIKLESHLFREKDERLIIKYVK
jgi:hypothetical protein